MLRQHELIRFELEASLKASPTGVYATLEEAITPLLGAAESFRPWHRRVGRLFALHRVVYFPLLVLAAAEASGPEKEQSCFR